MKKEKKWIRRKYSVDFKAKIVKELLEGGKSTRLLEAEYCIGSSTLQKLRNQYLKKGCVGIESQPIGRPEGSVWLG